MEEKVELNGEQEAALAVMLSGWNVFLTGEAGTGKSTLLREFIRRCECECIVVAPTGIAALNAGGTTIHSQFMLKPGLLDPTGLDPVTDGRRYRVLRTAQTVVVDEISMVRSDLFCAMDARLVSLPRASVGISPLVGGRWFSSATFCNCRRLSAARTSDATLPRDWAGVSLLKPIFGKRRSSGRYH